MKGTASQICIKCNNNDFLSGKMDQIKRINIITFKLLYKIQNAQS